MTQVDRVPFSLRLEINCYNWVKNQTKSHSLVIEELIKEKINKQSNVKNIQIEAFLRCLSNRPKEVMYLIVKEGLSTKELAKKLQLSRRTIENYVTRDIITNARTYLNIDTLKKLIVFYYNNKDQFDYE